MLDKNEGEKKRFGLRRIGKILDETKAHLLSQKAREMRAEVAALRAPTSYLEVFLEGEGPHIILFLNDIHYGSDTVDYGLLAEVVEFIEQHPNAYVVILGDEIEGSEPRYRSTIESHRTGGDVTEEIVDYQKAVLDKIGSRVIGAVGHFFGHTGWVEDQANVDPWKFIYEKYGIPVLSNGARVSLKYQNEKGETLETIVDVAHYFSQGRSLDPLNSVRTHWKKRKGENKPHIVASGHDHQTAIGVEHYPRAPVPAILVRSGTFKGVNPRLPADPFASKAGLDTAPGRPGQMVILSNKGARYAALDLPQGDVIHAAIDLWEGDNNLALEAIDKANENPPKIKFLSRAAKPSDEEEPLPEMPTEGLNGGSQDYQVPKNGVIYSQKDLAPLYDQVSYNVITEWPILFWPIANIRIGSSYSGFEELKKMIGEYVTGNPHVFIAFLGNVIDKQVAGRADRVGVLDALVELIELIGAERVLALLLDSVMRDDKWRKPIEGIDYVPPGTYVSKATQVPLMPGGSTVEIFHGSQTKVSRSKASHKILLLDGLLGLGSHSKALSGLNSYRVHHDDSGHDAIVSGHLSHAGAGTYQNDGQNVNYIDAGWLSPFDGTHGKKNTRRTAKGGQALIIHKDMRIPTSNWGETMELFNAFLALVAVRKFKMV